MRSRVRFPLGSPEVVPPIRGRHEYAPRRLRPTRSVPCVKPIGARTARRRRSELLRPATGELIPQQRDEARVVLEAAAAIARPAPAKGRYEARAQQRCLGVEADHPERSDGYTERKPDRKQPRQAKRCVAVSGAPPRAPEISDSGRGHTPSCRCNASPTPPRPRYAGQTSPGGAPARRVGKWLEPNWIRKWRGGAPPQVIRLRLLGIHCAMRSRSGARACGAGPSTCRTSKDGPMARSSASYSSRPSHLALQAAKQGAIPSSRARREVSGGQTARARVVRKLVPESGAPGREQGCARSVLARGERGGGGQHWGEHVQPSGLLLASTRVACIFSIWGLTSPEVVEMPNKAALMSAKLGLLSAKVLREFQMWVFRNVRRCACERLRQAWKLARQADKPQFAHFRPRSGISGGQQSGGRAP